MRGGWIDRNEINTTKMEKHTGETGTFFTNQIKAILYIKLKKKIKTKVENLFLK